MNVTLLCCVFQCPPCRGFTPTLMRVYERLRADGRNFEVVLVSSDRSEESYRTYVSAMPWLAVPYGDQRCASLTKHFGVQGQASYSLLALNSVFELLLRSMIFHVCFHPCKRFFSSVCLLVVYTGLYVYCRHSNPDHPGRRKRHHHDERPGTAHQGPRRQGASPTKRFSICSASMCITTALFSSMLI